MKKLKMEEGGAAGSGDQGSGDPADAAGKERSGRRDQQEEEETWEDLVSDDEEVQTDPVSSIFLCSCQLTR